MSQANTVPLNLTAKDFASDQDVRWCPGCGDYSILAQVKNIMPSLSVPREKYVFVSGIGCSSRFPYYMNTYGFHSIHGRAPGIATGIAAANPELQIWIATGDGDGLSIGGNHLLHAMRRNINARILLFNNRIYGLTKGQYSPTSELGKKTKSSPYGTIDNPLSPISVALGAECTFVARTVDVDVKHLRTVLERAAKHQGTGFIEIYQNCNVFNDGAFEYASDKDVKLDHILYLEHGKPMVFGKNREKGIRLNNGNPEVVMLGNGISEDDLLFHDENAAEPTVAFMLSRMRHPEFPEPMGVFRVSKQPTFEDRLMAQLKAAIAKQGPGKIEDLFDDGETWVVE